MAITNVDLGSVPAGAGGDTLREAFTKVNANNDEFDARGYVPAGGTTGQVLEKLSATDFVTQWADPDSFARPTVVWVPTVAEGTPATYELDSDDDGRVFCAYGSSEYVLEIPQSLGTLYSGFQALIVGQTTAGVTIDYSGYTVVGSHFPANEVTFTDVPFAVSLMVYNVGGTITIFLHGGSAKLDTVTTVYDSGWPAARPYATTVLAVGGTAAPGWLTSADVWLEDVS